MNRWNLIIYAPAYNVEKPIKEFLKRVRTLKKKLAKQEILIKRLIIVDDGSKDRTLKILEKFRRENSYLEIIEHKQNYGPVKSIIDGMAKAYVEGEKLNEKNLIFVRMDTDMEHDPLEIKKMIKHIINKKLEVVVGISNFSNYPFYWRLFNKIIGEDESKRFLDMKIPQFCPGFISFEQKTFGITYLKLKEIAGKYEKQFKEKMLTMDIISLIISKQNKARIKTLKLNPTNKEWVKNPRLSKLTYYLSCHNKLMKFLQIFINN